MRAEIREIVEDIFGDLSSDYEQNLLILDQKKEKYKEHPKYNNIIDKILIQEKQYLSKENKIAYDKMMDTYVESINYGINLATNYFQKQDIENTKKVLETLIKSFSTSYMNDEFGNCVYFDNDTERNLYKIINEDDRLVFECKANKGYVYYMYGRVLLETNQVKEALLSFDLAKTYSPFLKEAYFFKALMLKVNKKFDEAKEVMLEAHKYIYDDKGLADFFYLIGNYCYKFINKKYEFIMYQKSYEISKDEELYNEIKQIKPVDENIEFNEELFLEVCHKEGIPTGFNDSVVDL